MFQYIREVADPFRCTRWQTTDYFWITMGKVESMRKRENVSHEGHSNYGLFFFHENNSSQSNLLSIVGEWWSGWCLQIVQLRIEYIEAEEAHFRHGHLFGYGMTIRMSIGRAMSVGGRMSILVAMILLLAMINTIHTVHTVHAVHAVHFLFLWATATWRHISIKKRKTTTMK